MVIVEDPHARGDALPLGPVPRARHHTGAHRTGRLVRAVVFGGDDQRRADLARCDCHGSRGRTRDHGRGLIDLDADRKHLRQIATSPQRDQDVAAFHDARARGGDRDQRHARRGHDGARFVPQHFRVAGVVVQAHLDLQALALIYAAPHSIYAAPHSILFVERPVERRHKRLFADCRHADPVG